MSDVVTFLSNIPRLRDDRPPQQENGRYTLLSLMDAAQDVPSTSMQVLPHTPAEHCSSQAEQQQHAIMVPGIALRPAASELFAFQIPYASSERDLFAVCQKSRILP